MSDGGLPDFSRPQERYDIEVYWYKDVKGKKIEVNYNAHFFD